MSERRTVLIADDHALTRQAVADILTAAGFDVVATSADAPSALALAVEHQPDICLLDVHMPGNGIEAARQIHERCHATSVVMLTVAQDDDTLFQALRAGARGYLLKGTDADAMVEALDKLLDGEPALSSGIAMRILEHLGTARSRRLSVRGRPTAELSPREAAVLDLLQQGLRTSEIASHLYISNATVRTHIAAILRKLDVSTRAEALALLAP